MPSNFIAIKALFRLFFVTGICPVTINMNAEDNQSTFSFVSLFYSAAPLSLILLINIFSLYGIFYMVKVNKADDQYYYRDNAYVNRYSDIIAVLMYYICFSIFYLASIRQRKMHCQFLSRCIVIESRLSRYPMMHLRQFSSNTYLLCRVIVIILLFWTNFVCYRLKSPDDKVGKICYFIVVVGYYVQYQTIGVFVAYMRFLVTNICERFYKEHNCDWICCPSDGESLSFVQCNNPKLRHLLNGLNECLKRKRIFGKVFATQITILAMYVTFSITAMIFTITIRQLHNVGATAYNRYDFCEHILMPVLLMVDLVRTVQRFGMQVIICK